MNDLSKAYIKATAYFYVVMAGAFAALGLAVPPDEAIKGIVGLSLPVAMDRLAPGASEVTLDALVAGYKHSYAERRRLHGADGSPMFPGARAALLYPAVEGAVALSGTYAQRDHSCEQIHLGLLDATGWSTSSMRLQIARLLAGLIA